jgi:hypothetical protein
MKEIKLVWQQKHDRDEDNILSLYCIEKGYEIGQLRRSADYEDFKNYMGINRYADRIWQYRSVCVDDGQLQDYFGPNCQHDLFRGFRSVSEFKNWLEEKTYVC